tara:strand:- start:3924 stop:4772 length:849 start_codon:yes stop_codon:yes gene_type:complete
VLRYLYHKIPYKIQNYINKAASRITGSFEENFINDNNGYLYGLDKNARIKIVDRIRFNFSKIESATSLISHLELFKRILQLPPENKDYLVECGCYKGSTSITLSIAAKIIGRELIIYDSFEGLPPDDNIDKRFYPHVSITGQYAEGMYSAQLDDVKKNIEFFGEMECVQLRKGYFNESLKSHNERIDFLFLDVDLVSSTQECIKYLWSFINDNSYIFTDDACDMDVVKVWFDENWWRDNFASKAPGYIGSGCGLPLNYNYSALGYTIKNPDISKYTKPDWLK